MKSRRYSVTVHDKTTGQTVNYLITAFNERQADTEARHGFTGLLGGPALEKVRARLEVAVTELKEPYRL